jgi:hypothetical protein
MKTVLLAFVLSSLPLSAAIAQSCTKHSPSYSVALLELYTSQGCSSCPPAEKTLSQLRNNKESAPLGLDRVVPLALHVDYWNYIGWQDVFSDRVYTDRQRWLSGLAASRTIYTPEVFVAGKELRDWSGSLPAVVKRINSTPAKADIKISVGKIDAGAIATEVVARAAEGGNLYVALYENALSTDIKAGENSGVTLQHDFVVRQWVGPLPLGDSKNTAATLSRALTVPIGAQVKNLGVAAFVQSRQGEVLQALALPVLCQTH